MKILKSNLFLVVALVIAGGTLSFKMASTTNLWHYTETSTPGDYTDPYNWSLGSSDESCSQFAEKPCEISVDATNRTELAGVFTDMDNEDVLEINPTSRKD